MRNAARMAIACALLCALHGALPTALRAGEADLRKKIHALHKEGNESALDAAIAEYVKAYPKNDFAPTARMIAAEHASSPDDALARYLKVRDAYPSGPARSMAALRACEILYLAARWNDLITEARAGLSLTPAPEGEPALRMGLLLARALIHRERFDEARAALTEVIAAHHDYDGLAEALLLRSHVERRTTGYSRAYLLVLKELAAGFGESGAAASGLYLLGRYYENRADYDRAFSAMSDVVKRYPSSPEAGYARERIEGYAPRNPRFVDYLPDETQMKSADVIDIRPETGYQGAEKGADSYAVSVGPFYDPKDAKEVALLVKGEFSPVETVNIQGRYTIYVGRVPDAEAALAVKTRLAEEYALNGSVVRIRKRGNKQYIYGE